MVSRELLCPSLGYLSAKAFKRECYSKPSPSDRAVDLNCQAKVPLVEPEHPALAAWREQLGFFLTAQSRHFAARELSAEYLVVAGWPRPLRFALEYASNAHLLHRTENDLIARPDKPTTALAVLDEPERVKLLPWNSSVERVLQRRRVLIGKAEGDPEVLESLRLIEDRYKRIRIPVTGRPNLPPEVVLHLGLKPSLTGWVYLWRVRDALELNSINYRFEHLDTESEALIDLP